MKVFDLARELKTDLKGFIHFLRDVDIKVKSGGTKLEDTLVEEIRALYKDEKSGGSKDQDEDEGPKQVLFVGEKILVADFASLLKVKLSEIMKACLENRLLVNMNSELDYEMSKTIALSLEIELVRDVEDEGKKTELKDRISEIEEEELVFDDHMFEDRPPVITIMGHVDHGKTLLLDTIRKTNVVDKEAGGITQHIGAYQVTVKDKALTFLDTPGHAAFTTLRARGAQVTDIAILVVAADESVKPQTIEAIHHAQAAKTPIIVAINKMDKPEADVDRCKQDLSQNGLLSEEWGGKVVMVPISAKSGEGIDELLEMIALESEMLELKSVFDGKAKAVVIESRLSREKGPVATVLIKTGTLSVGDHFVVGSVAGKVRALFNDAGDKVASGTPGMPIEILGFSDVPLPGNILEVMASDKKTREVAAKRRLEEKEGAYKGASLEVLSEGIEDGDIQTLNLIVKGDVNGSLEAIIHTIERIETERIPVQIVHSGTGNVSVNDIMLARASNALVVAFGVQTEPDAEKLSEIEKIQVKEYTVIYEIFDDVKKVLKGMYKPEFEECETGRLEIRQIFKFSKVGNIAGSYVLSGKVIRNCQARVLRDGEEIFDGKIVSVKRFKEDVREVKEGFECGLVFEKYDDLKESDVVVCYELREKKLI
ncbi:MAG: translation initiation factor IF-2 [Candidatus Marinamargulisbacteria bacterium]|jgi:translation initiation factor IF-2